MEGREDPGKTTATRGGTSGGGRSPVARLWYVLLLVPIVALLWVPFYASVEPRLFGFPFFYWYQFLWVPLTAIICAVVFRGTR